jgi:hypothetical protein
MTTMLVGERVNMSKRTFSSEHEKNLKAYSMPCHGILLVFFATWILLNDVAKYSTTSQNIM